MKIIDASFKNVLKSIEKHLDSNAPYEQDEFKKVRDFYTGIVPSDSEDKYGYVIHAMWHSGGWMKTYLEYDTKLKALAEQFIIDNSIKEINIESVIHYIRPLPDENMGGERWWWSFDTAKLVAYPVTNDEIDITPTQLIELGFYKNLAEIILDAEGYGLQPVKVINGEPYFDLHGVIKMKSERSI